MRKIPSCIVTEDPWGQLKTFTDARIGLGRVGSSMPVSKNLSLKLAHAQARDAVHLPFDKCGIVDLLNMEGIPCHPLESSVIDRSEYLTRPDKGRILNDISRDVLATAPKGWDISVVVCDGLSSRAIHENCVDFLTQFWQLFSRSKYSLAPVSVVNNGRVAIGDEIGELLGAQLTVTLIGERPGLSSPNSLGIYMTYGPRAGMTDELRNCLSNIRDKGMSIPAAVQKLAYLIERAFSEKISGVQLKDKMRPDYQPLPAQSQKCSTVNYCTSEASHAA